MKTASIIFLALLSFSVQAQYCARDYNHKDFQHFLSTKITYVQKTGNPFIDSIYEAALTKHWTISKFKMLSEKEIQKEYSNSSVSLLLLFHNQIKSGEYVECDYSLCGLVLGGEAKLKDLPMIAFASTDYYNITNYFRNPMKETEREEKIKSIRRRSGFEYRLEDVVTGINDAVKIVKEGQYKFRPDMKSGLDFMNKNIHVKEMGILKTKTLYVQSLDVTIKTREKAKAGLSKSYPYKIEFVSPQKFDEVVAGKVENAAYMVLTHTYLIDALIITDANTHKCLGGKLFSIVYQLDEGDFKDVASLIEKSDKP